MFLRKVILVRLVLLGALVPFLHGCATTQATTEDPLEEVNRGMYAVNDSLDKAFMAPLAESYIENTSEGFRDSVTNFYDNAAYPGVVLNDILQFKLVQAGGDSLRFFINSTIGIGGLLDPATEFGLPEHDEDFGQTLGVWGADEGVFLMLPLYGPSSLRDVTDLVVSSFTNVFFFIETGPFGIPLTVLDMVNTRANLSSAIRLRDASALDPYVFTREAFRQKRTNLIHDGNLPDEEFELDDDQADVDDPFAEDAYADGTGGSIN